MAFKSRKDKIKRNRMHRLIKQKNRHDIKLRRIREKRKKRNLIWALSILMLIFIIAISVFFIKEIFLEKIQKPEITAIDTNESVNADEDVDIEDTETVEIKDEKLEKSQKQKFKINKNPGLLDNEIKTYLRKNSIDIGDIGFVYKNLKTGVELKINGDEVFLAASVMKVPINMLTYDLAFEENLDLSTELTYYPQDKEGGTGILQGESIGSSYPIEELLELMITHSDNVATNIMYRFLGGYHAEYLLDTLARVYGISSYNGNYITPNESEILLEKLYNNEDKNPYYQKLLDDMKNTIYNEYFSREIKGVKIAHKTGDYDGYYNDIGIVYDSEPFIFAVFTNNLSYASNVLADIGKIVYDWHVE